MAKKSNEKLINTFIIIGIIFLIGSLALMFIKNGTTDKHLVDISYSEYEKKMEEDEYNIRHKIIKQEEEEKEILQKIIECFNSSSDNISLNASFEENSYNEDENYVGYKFLNDSNINDKNIFGIL